MKLSFLSGKPTILIVAIFFLLSLCLVGFIKVDRSDETRPQESFSISTTKNQQDSIPEYGPWEGMLPHRTGKASYFETKIYLVDFIVESTFYNPHSLEKGGWDYGIAFRGSGNNVLYFYVTSNSEYILKCYKDGNSSYPARGSLSNLDLSPSGKNKIRLEAIGNKAQLYINNLFITDMDISCSNYKGMVSIFTGFSMPGISGEVTEFSGFTIDEVDPLPSTRDEVLSTGFDSDMDGIDDETEWRIARTYSPVLQYDEDETEDVINVVVPLYQVSPYIHSNGKEGAMLVFVFLYDGDYGADFDQGWKDWFTDPISTIGGAIMDPFDQMFGKHCGDTEVIYFFIENGSGDWQDTWLESIFWKRHYDPIYETPENKVSYVDIGDGFGRTHPLIYVSEDKHGMYPNHTECENYQTDVVQERIKNAIDIKIPLTPKMEDCSGGDRINFANLSNRQNVGEAISEKTMNRTTLNGTIYEGYDPWENVEFWGRTDYEKLCIDPAGGLGGKWCGSPHYNVNMSYHPCNSSDWWGVKQSSGYCMNPGVDRIGADYYSYRMEIQSAEHCAYTCFFHENCVAYSYVLPVAGSSYGTCYFKNFANKPIKKAGAVSGLSQDCYSMNWVPPESE